MNAAVSHIDVTRSVRILLLGDSTVLGSVPRLVAPTADHLEDILAKRLAREPGLPPVQVINKGQDNDTIKGMLQGRYTADVGGLPGSPLDYVFIRFGINDRSYLADWAGEFPATYHELIQRIRHDQPRAAITLETIIPYRDEASTRQVNECIRRIAVAEGLPVLDTHELYAARLRNGPHALNYRRIELSAVPPDLRHALSGQEIVGDAVIVMDGHLDAHLGHLPGWFADRHPNLAGYEVIGGALAQYLIPWLRAMPARR